MWTSSLDMQHQDVSTQTGENASGKIVLGSSPLKVKKARKSKLKEDSTGGTKKKRNRTKTTLVSVPTNTIDSPSIRQRSNSNAEEPPKEATVTVPQVKKQSKTPRGMNLKLTSMRSSPSSVVRSHKNMVTREKPPAISRNVVLASMKQEEIIQKSAVFGRPLDKLMKQQNSEEFLSDIPLIVNWTSEHIKNRGISTSGIFRESGHHGKQLELQELIDSGCPLQDLHLDDVDEHTVGALLRSFLRNLPDSIIPRDPFFPILVQISAFSDAAFRLSSYRSLLQCLPRRNYALVKYLCFFLKDVASHSDTNLMSYSNLALVFGPSIFGSIAADIKFRDEKLDPMFMFREVKFVSMLTEEIIEEADFLFTGDAKKAQAYRSRNHFPSPNGKHLSVLRGDTFVVLSETDSVATILMRESTGKIAKQVLHNSDLIPLGETKTRELINLFTNGNRVAHARNSVVIAQDNSRTSATPKRSRNQKRFADVFKFNSSILIKRPSTGS